MRLDRGALYAIIEVPMNFWIKIGGLLVLVWAIAGGVIYWSRHAQVTADSLAAYVQENSLSGMAASKRAASIERMEGMLNRLSFEERQKVDRAGTTRKFFKEMTEDERMAFMDATLPTGFKQLMESFNKMDPVKRKQILDRALADMKKHEGEEPPPNVDDRLSQKMVEHGLHSVYTDANADVKLDLAPLIEQMQKNLQYGR